MEETRFNAGYELTDWQIIGDTEIVIGKNEKIGEYVCWLSRDGKNFNHGHYSTDILAVEDTYFERIATQLELSTDPSYRLPDPSISIADMKEFGYTWNGMLPLSAERALALHNEGFRIFEIRSDGGEGMVEEDLNVDEADMFGIEVETWIAKCDFDKMQQVTRDNFMPIMEETGFIKKSHNHER